MTALAPDVRTENPPTRPADPRWVRPALLALLAGTGLLYLVGLGASAWANSFYSAAVQAGASSWKAFFFGSSDAANAITVDKTPMSLWVMDISARIFGVNAWSILVPQALAGIASVGLLYATVRRWFPPYAALLSGLVLAVTPVAVLMFRYNNPDALLVLLLVAAAYATVRAVERASTGWLLCAGAFVGFGFLTKMLQAFLVLPAFAVVYLVAAPTGIGRRIRQVLLAGLSTVVAGGWWVAVVTLIPAADRPYIGGSPANSVLELALGYNGFGRLTGDEAGGLGNTNQDAGWLRLFGAEMGGQVSWLLPAALLLLVAGWWMSRGAPRTDRTRAAFALWGGWLLVTGLVFSLSNGIIHPYYTVALAPAIGALVGMGVGVLWPLRRQPAAVLVLAGAVVLTVSWSTVLLGRMTDWQPWLRMVVPVTGLIAAAILLLSQQVGRWLAGTAAVVALLASLAGPAAYAVDTAATAHSGAIPSAGPVGIGGFGPVAGFRGGPGGFRGGTTGFRGGPGGMLGILGGSTPSTELVNLLRANAGAYTWVAATVGSNNAAGYQLATDDPVLAVGGYNGTDLSPTLAAFEQYVRAGKIHYFIGSGGIGSGTAGQIAQWVAEHFTATTVGGETVYDLTV